MKSSIYLSQQVGKEKHIVDVKHVFGKSDVGKL